MELQLEPARLFGTLQAATCKSAANRALACAALSDKPTELSIYGLCEEIERTIAGLRALGAGIAVSEDAVRVKPILRRARKATVFCGASLPTLHLLLPVAGALFVRTSFLGVDSPGDPILPTLLAQMRQHGCRSSAPSLPLSLSGRLQGGIFTLPGPDAEFPSGLLLALSRCEEGSRLCLGTPPLPGGIVERTVQTMERFGVPVRQEGDTLFVRGGTSYRAPAGRLALPGDWSVASYYCAANALGSDVHMPGLGDGAQKADLELPALLAHMRRSSGDLSLDISPMPDFFPPLIVAACGRMGKTVFMNTQRLCPADTERLRLMANMVSALGGRAETKEDQLVITGTGRLSGGTMDSRGDPFVGMACAIAALLCTAPVLLKNAEAVTRFHPRFWKEYLSLGGKARANRGGFA